MSKECQKTAVEILDKAIYWMRAFFWAYCLTVLLPILGFVVWALFHLRITF